MLVVTTVLATVHRVTGWLHRRLPSVEVRDEKSVPELVFQAGQRLHPVSGCSMPRITLSLVHSETMRAMEPRR